MLIDVATEWWDVLPDDIVLLGSSAGCIYREIHMEYRGGKVRCNRPMASWFLYVGRRSVGQA